MQDATAVPDDVSPELVLSEERLTAETRTVQRGRVRVSKRVVVEDRTITVRVRREELVIEELPAHEQAGAPAPGSRGTGPVLDLLLSEEEVDVVIRPVPRERVRLYVDTVTSDERVDASLQREDVTVETETLRP